MYGDKISVIIPIYNMQEYLDKCIESVRNQTYHNLEIILVDDGSTDQSVLVCQKHQKMDARINVIEKENGGLVSARKTGIEKASGEYITFVDADDWIDADAYETVLSGAEDEDVIAYGMEEDYGYKQLHRKNNIPAGQYDNDGLQKIVIPQMLYCNNFFEFGILPNLVCKIIKRTILLSFYQKINNCVTIGEDADFTYHALQKANSLRIVNASPYHYIQRADSMMRTNASIDGLKGLFADLQTVDKEDVQWQKQVQAYMSFLLLLKWTEIYVKRTPFFKQFTGKKIIIYGAGNYGQAVSRSLENGLQVEIVGMADQDWKQLQKKNSCIGSLQDVLKKKFDYIYIGILNERVCREIKAHIISEGIEPDKILYYGSPQIDMVQIKEYWK